MPESRRQFPPGTPCCDITDTRHDGRETVLVVGTDDWAIEQGASSLESAGHRVLRCHEPGRPAFPCNALTPEGICPLDVGFDVVVTMRGHALSPPPAGEFGVVCGLRAGAGLIVGGLGGTNPFEDWETGIIESGEELSTAVARVAADRRSGLRLPAS